MANDDRNRACNLWLAKLAEQAERYDDMVSFMDAIIKLGLQGNELETEERNLISVGYKNKMSTRRTAWRTVNERLKDKEKEKAPAADIQLLKEYRDWICQEIKTIIDEVKKNVVEKFMEGPLKATEPEVVVFFKKMEGDYYRYGAEISAPSAEESGDLQMYKEKARAAYEQATTAAVKLTTTNPIRLGLALNFSVFYFEICDEKDMATELAKQAFDDAINDLDSLEEDKYKDSTLIMQLLKDNLTLWQEQGDDDDDIEVEQLND